MRISDAELGLMLPRSSGEYNFPRRIYDPVLGFVPDRLSATVGFAAPVALAVMAFMLERAMPRLKAIIGGGTGGGSISAS
jgi:hypothetical protein